jgi:hypothetical protein
VQVQAHSLSLAPPSQSESRRFKLNLVRVIYLWSPGRLAASRRDRGASRPANHWPGPGRTVTVAAAAAPGARRPAPLGRCGSGRCGSGRGQPPRRARCRPGAGGQPESRSHSVCGLQVHCGRGARAALAALAAACVTQARLSLSQVTGTVTVTIHWQVAATSLRPVPPQSESDWQCGH